MGICFTKEDDEKLARGWPNLVVAVDGRKEDKSAAAANWAWSASDPIFFTEWPRKTLHRFMHAAIETLFFEPANMTDDAATRRDAALERSDAPSAEQSLQALRLLFREGYDTYRFKERDFVWTVEAIAGADATLGA